VTPHLSRGVAPLLAAAATLVGAASAAPTAQTGFGAVDIALGATGPTPASLQVRAYHVLPGWVNSDSVAHRVTFDNGLCTVTVPAGGRESCRSTFLLYAGKYRYEDTGSRSVGEILVVPNERRVTLTSMRRTIRAGETLVLRGSVFAAAVGGIAGLNLPQRVTIFRRAEGSRHFVQIRTVRSCNCAQRNLDPWSISIRPTKTATYLARIVDSRSKMIWEPAESGRIVVRVIG